MIRARKKGIFSRKKRYKKRYQKRPGGRPKRGLPNRKNASRNVIFIRGEGFLDGEEA